METKPGLKTRRTKHEGQRCSATASSIVLSPRRIPDTSACAVVVPVVFSLTCPRLPHKQSNFEQHGNVSISRPAQGTGRGRPTKTANLLWPKWHLALVPLWFKHYKWAATCTFRTNLRYTAFCGVCVRVTQGFCEYLCDSVPHCLHSSQAAFM